MIKIENTGVFGWEAAICGIRNPLESWDKSDSGVKALEFEDGYEDEYFALGDADIKLMRNLIKAGSDYAKFLRMINVTCDITAPLYWWSEYDTYKVGTVTNSCSMMHCIHKKEFTLKDFSCEHLKDFDGYNDPVTNSPAISWFSLCLEIVIDDLNFARKLYLETKGKKYWWQMIQLLPTSYNQKRTVQLNYQVLLNMYHARKSHKLDEWVELCKWMETLPYFKEICLEEKQ